MENQFFSINSDTPVPHFSAARAARELRDVRMLKMRVRNPATLREDLADFGAGYHIVATAWRTALLKPPRAYTARERRDIRADIAACAACQAACQEELISLAAVDEPADLSPCRELANLAMQRAQNVTAPRSHSA